ncbi:putative endo-beta-1,6-glucanase [Venustampulla echinocandica]|uniref:glucan endo-1,6-beta-glucosidase n=1 Tax=Venustampulla echinocandica TaxID=2656787 RepID=A0A370TBB1_9HELO|nr:putative endo-beta-1,6-glucanase [Venustampulla echinocandica]RDL31330.1 putative endo-beta-1,6-glucanase [Venustampulla echinocandica]
MYLVSYIFMSAILAAHAAAWLPGEHREIYSLEGINLFNKTKLFSNITSNSTKKWLPSSSNIRGVNLGCLFVFEPWLASDEWGSMGCGPYVSEFDCVSALGQSQANVIFQNHWDSWITQDDITQIQSFGLNTIRIPIGYWIMESLVYDSEYFPQGGFQYLQRLCGWASDVGLYIIIDLHGAPGAQVPTNPNTGQYAPSAGFYIDWQFDRATKFLSWLTNIIHTQYYFRNVGMIGVVNEPIQNPDAVPGLLSSFYPNAYTAIRNVESALGVASYNSLHVQPMNQLWGSGSPNQNMPSTYFMAYDDHRYVKWDPSVPVSHSAYITDACNNNRNRSVKVNILPFYNLTDSSDNNTPTIVGEFSLSVPDNVQWSPDWHPSNNQGFYSQWFAAQVSRYEADTDGWIFWTWKSQLGDYRWSYQDAIAAGVIPSDIGNINTGACNSF